MYASEALLPMALGNVLACQFNLRILREYPCTGPALVAHGFYLTQYATDRMSIPFIITPIQAHLKHLE